MADSPGRCGGRQQQGGGHNDDDRATPGACRRRPHRGRRDLLVAGVMPVARYVATRRFLAGHDAAWVEAWRRRLEVKAARGNVAEALYGYERLRALLREELGVAPSPAVQAVHRRLLLESASDEHDHLT